MGGGLIVLSLTLTIAFFRRLIYLIGLLTLLLTGSSCFDLEADPVDFGPPTTQEKISEALNGPLLGQTPFNILKGEFVALEDTQALANGEPSILADTGITVIQSDISEDGNTISLRWLEDIYRYNGDQTEHQIMDFSKSYVRNSVQQQLDLKQLASSQLQALEVKVQAMDPNLHLQALGDEIQTYHDLQIRQEVSAPPEAVAQDPQCGGIKSCQIRISTISYAQVLWIEGQPPQKVGYVFRVSPDVPYFARVLDLCATAMVPIQGQRYRVEQCTRVRNFQFGTGPSSSSN